MRHAFAIRDSLEQFAAYGVIGEASSMAPQRIQLCTRTRSELSLSWMP